MRELGVRITVDSSQAEAAIDKVESKLKLVEKSATQTGLATDKLQASFTQMTQALTLNGGAADSVLGKFNLLEAAAAGLSDVFGVLLVGAGAAAGAILAVGAAAFVLAERVAPAGAQLLDLSRQTGASVEGLSRLQNALKVSGGSLDEFVTAMSAFERNGVEHADKVADGLARVGVNAQELEGLSLDDKLKRIAAGFADTVDPADRLVAAQELFNDHTGKLIPQLLTLNEAMRATADVNPWTAEAAENAKQFELHLGEIKAHFGQLEVSLGEKVIPYMDRFVQSLIVMQSWTPSKWLQLLLMGDISGQIAGMAAANNPKNAPFAAPIGDITLPADDPRIIETMAAEMDKLLEAWREANAEFAKRELQKAMAEARKEGDYMTATFDKLILRFDGATTGAKAFVRIGGDLADTSAAAADRIGDLSVATKELTLNTVRWVDAGHGAQSQIGPFLPNVQALNTKMLQSANATDDSSDAFDNWGNVLRRVGRDVSGEFGKFISYADDALKIWGQATKAANDYAKASDDAARSAASAAAMGAGAAAGGLFIGAVYAYIQASDKAIAASYQRIANYNDALTQSLQDLGKDGIQKVTDAYVRLGRTVEQFHADQQAALFGDAAAIGRITQAEKDALWYQDQLNQKLQQQQDTYKELNDDIQKYKITEAELGPTLQNQHLVEQTTALIRAFTLMTAAGIPVNVVLSHMADDFNTVVKNAQQMGLKLPLELKPILTQLAAAGLLTDQFGNKVADVNKLDFAPDLNQSIQDMTSAVGDLVKVIKEFLGLFDTKGPSHGAPPGKWHTDIAAGFHAIGDEAHYAARGVRDLNDALAGGSGDGSRVPVTPTPPTAPAPPSGGPIKRGANVLAFVPARLTAATGASGAMTVNVNVSGVWDKRSQQELTNAVATGVIQKAMNSRQFSRR